MLEIILHQIPDTVMLEHAGRITGNALDSIQGAIFHAIPDGGITPEEVFHIVMTKEEFNQPDMAPHHFFLAIVSLLDKGFISTSTRAVGDA